MKVKVHCKYDRLVAAGKLKPNPRNPRTHGAEQVEALARIIKETGWRRAVVVSKRSGLIVRGHGAVEAAKAIGCLVPVEVQTFKDSAEETAHMIADNRLNELSEWNDTELAGLLKDLQQENLVELSGFDQDAFSELVLNLESHKLSEEEARKTLAERFGVPPFSVLDARQGYWQDRKRAWIALGIQSELGRGGGANHECGASDNRGVKTLSEPAGARRQCPPCV